jgi:pimeloyl-ACP methyl ester carboxylesterase
VTTTQTYTEQTTTVAGLELRTLVGGAGPDLLWLHHSTGSLGWLPFHESLAQHFRVWVPDLPGYGRSQRPDWARHPRDIALLLNRATAKLGLSSPLLVGHGFGGWLAAELATMNPTAFSALVLVGAAGIKPREGEIMDQIMWDYDDYVKQGFREESAYTAMFGERVDKEIWQLWDLSREMTARLTWSPWMFNRQLPPLLPETETRTLLVWGAADRVVPPAVGEQYAAGLPNATLEVLPNVGHLVELEQPQILAARIVAFANES